LIEKREKRQPDDLIDANMEKMNHSQDWTNLAESSKENYAPIAALFPMMIMIMLKRLFSCC
jgi:hypothetical protein